MTNINDIDKKKILNALHSARRDLKKHKNIFDQSLKKFDSHISAVTTQCTSPEISFSDDIIKSIKTCTDTKSIFYARDCLKPYLKDLCINIRADTFYHNLEKSYIPFPNPNILEQFNTNNIPVDLFETCFSSYTPEHSLSKFINFFSPECYINFKNYQDMLDEFQ